MVQIIRQRTIGKDPDGKKGEHSEIIGDLGKGSIHSRFELARDGHREEDEAQNAHGNIDETKSGLRVQMITTHLLQRGKSGTM